MEACFEKFAVQCAQLDHIDLDRQVWVRANRMNGKPASNMAEECDTSEPGCM
jgi:hypothetical protein